MKAEGNADKKLREFLTTYRFTPSYGLGNKSPSELMNSRTMKTKLDLLHLKQKDYGQRNTAMEEQFNTAHGARDKKFEIGDQVYYKLHKSNNSWQWSPAIILECIGAVNYSIKLESERIVNKAHANQLKLRHTRNEIIDVFGLSDISETEIEPTVIPQDAGNRHN